MRLLLAAILSLGLLTACATTPEAVAEPGLKRRWMLVEWPASQLYPPAAQARLDLRSLPNASAFMGCNQLKLQVAVRNPRQAGGTLDIRPGGATRMHCNGRMALEQAFIRQIGRFKHYRLAGHRLTLEDAAGNTIRLIAEDWD
ncbi:MAG: META domain-containing protein [Eikenella sp.]|nr:META domain-containing protein [Eikenella sp.]